MTNNSINNYEISDVDGVITFKNKNTTIGFIRFNDNGEIEYIFVNNLSILHIVSIILVNLIFL